jgi:hypothetical protein
MIKCPLILGLLGITALVFANAAYAVIAIDSSAVDLSRLDVSDGKTLVELVPAKDARGIPVRLRLYGDLRLSGFGRQNWFSGVIETEELSILEWSRPWRSTTRLSLRADAVDRDPIGRIRSALADNQAERLQDFEGLRAYRLKYEGDQFLGEPGEDRFTVMQCWTGECHTDIRIGPNLIGWMSFPDFRNNGGRAYANEQIAIIQKRVCELLVDAICWAKR